MEDDYPTCGRTHVTFRAYHESLGPEIVSEALDLEPSETQRVGDTYERRGKTHTYTITGWFLCSEGHVQSYDTSKHLSWLLDKLERHSPALGQLRTTGWRMDISCFWDSDAGHGGPTLEPALLQRLGTFGVEVWFDVYFFGEYLRIQNAKKINGIHPTA